MGIPNEVWFLPHSNLSWLFVFSNEVNIFCNLRVCMSRNCSFTNCSEPSSKRQRRHFAHPVSDLAEVRTLSMHLRFRRDDSRKVRFPDVSFHGNGMYCLGLSFNPHFHLRITGYGFRRLSFPSSSRTDNRLHLRVTHFDLTYFIFCDSIAIL